MTGEPVVEDKMNGISSLPGLVEFAQKGAEENPPVIGQKRNVCFTVVSPFENNAWGWIGGRRITVREHFAEKVFAVVPALFEEDAVRKV